MNKTRFVWGTALAVLTTLNVVWAGPATKTAVPTGAALLKQLQPTLHIGDKAPSIPVMAWIKGEPVTQFKPGHVYIVDFWATWCGVCIEGMPHLSALQKKYDGKLTVIGVDAKEMAHSVDPIDVAAVRAKVEASARKHADRMIYTVAMDHPVDEPVYRTWQRASGGTRVPNAIVVDGNGVIVWNAPPTGKWQEQFDAAVDAAVRGKSDLALGRKIFQAQYGDDIVYLGFEFRLMDLAKTDEEAALAYARAGFDVPEVRTALSYTGGDAQYWGAIGLALANRPDLSLPTTRIAAEYVANFVAASPGIPARSLGLAGLYYKLGENEKGAAQENEAMKLFRASGMDEAQVARVAQTLDRYRGAGGLTLKVGDLGPKLDPMLWIKGDPVKRFEPGHVYVVEFWATWCGPCISAMPHLSELQKKYAGRATFIGMNVRETERTDGTVDIVRKFVQRKGDNMGYSVAMDEPAKQPVFNSWMKAAGLNGIPASFVIDKQGRLVWVGHPEEEGADNLESAIEHALNGTNDVVAARARQIKMNQDSVAALARKAIIGPVYDAQRRKNYPLMVTEAEKLAAGHAEFESLAGIMKVIGLMHVDEKAAWAYARKRFSDPGSQEYANLGSGAERADAYWASTSASIASEEGLSRETYGLTAGYLLRGIARNPDTFSYWIALSRARKQLGDIQQAIKAQEKGMQIAREKMGFNENDLDSFKATLEELKSTN